MKNKQHIWFWILQVIGWGIPAGLNTFGKIVLKTQLNNSYIYAEGLLFFLSGITATTIVRFYLKNRLSFDKFQINELRIVAIGLLIGSMILSVLLLFISIPLYNFFHTKPHEITTTEIISTIINAILFVLFWIIIYCSVKLYYRFIQNKIEYLQLETSLKESQLSTLKGQINPHFLFNSLNNIRGLMLEDVEKSREMITYLSDMLRYSLTKNNIDKIALSEELKMIENYVELSKIQLEDRFTFNKKIDKTILATEIPPMLIQILIENAIKHGISNLSKGGIVTLSIQKEKQYLLIHVSNTGKLIINKTSTKLGLANVKKRLSLLYGEKAKFSLTEVNDKVIAKIKIPI